MKYSYCGGIGVGGREGSRISNAGFGNLIDFIKVELIGRSMCLPADDIDRSIYLGYRIYICISDWFILQKVINKHKSIAILLI